MVSNEAGRRATHQCIYCLRRLPASEFDREHVLSEAFGTFRHSLVLHHCVCRQCNQSFGDQLEVRFARGAFEGLLRYEHGVRTPKVGAISLRYVKLTVPGGNDWSGVRLQLVEEGSGLRVSLIPQAAFFDATQQRWVHATADEIDAGLLSDRPDLAKSQIRVYAGSSRDYEGIVSKLKEHGVNFRKEGDLRPPDGLIETPEMEVEVTFTVNRGIRRCVAKYAFNYLTFVCGPEFVVGSDFDVIREFVRHGSEPPYPVVVESFRPILHDDLPGARQSSGHLLTLNWARSGVDLIGKVSLFNFLTYSVSLCRRFSSSLWRPIRSGAHFDVQRRTIQALTPVSKYLMP